MATLLLVGSQTAAFSDLIVPLEKEGFTVLVANQDHEAIQLVQRHHLDIILYDVMPVMNGIAFYVVLQLNARSANIPVLFLVKPVERQLSEAYYIVKPFTVVDLLQSVKDIINQRRHWQLETPALSTAAGK